MMEKELKSAFNEGFFQVQRLHYSWAMCRDYSRRGMLDNWRWLLDTIWRELSNDALKLENPEEKENKYFKEVSEIDKVIGIARKFKLKEVYYRALNKKEILLRNLQERSGKGGKWVDADEDTMDV
jgi:hypothetical protein